MKKIFIAVLLLLFMACGSESTTALNDNEIDVNYDISKLSISCMTMAYGYGIENFCYDFVGDYQITNALSFIASIKNNSDSIAPIYTYEEIITTGCGEEHPIGALNSRIDINPHEELFVRHGFQFCYGCPGNCVTTGPAYIRFSVYNGVGLIYNSPQHNETTPLVTNTIYFNLVN